MDSTTKIDSSIAANGQQPTALWLLRDDVALASFSDGDTAFQAADCRMLALNESAAALLERLRQPLSIDNLVASCSEWAPPELSGATTDTISELLNDLESLRLVKRQLFRTCRWKENCFMNENSRYLANPDVSCRIEDEDGAMLYNPDTKSCQVINAVGLELWQALSEPRNRAELAVHLCDRYDGVTQEEADKDVKEFLERLIVQGFIGEVEE